jgi:hypothetical protein
VRVEGLGQVEVVRYCFAKTVAPEVGVWGSVAGDGDVGSASGGSVLLILRTDSGSVWVLGRGLRTR